MAQVLVRQSQQPLDRHAQVLCLYRHDSHASDTMEPRAMVMLPSHRSYLTYLVSSEPIRMPIWLTLCNSQRSICFRTSNTISFQLFFLIPVVLPLLHTKLPSVTPIQPMTHEQAMADTNHLQEWKEAMQKEISSLEYLGSWDKVNILDAKSRIIPGVWVFRVK